jgi:hypothetical protein
MNNIQHFQNNKNTVKYFFKKYIYSKVILVIILFFIYTVSTETLKFYNKKEIILNKYNSVKIDLDNINIDYENKKKYLDFIKTNRGQEEYLRDTLPVAGAGEQAIILYTASTSPVTEYKKEISGFDIFVKKIKFFIDNYTNL